MDKVAELEEIIAADYSNIAGVAVQKEGRMVYENYFHGSRAADRIHVFSVTKSILSILIGIAIDRGDIEAVHQKVLEFFPDYRVKKGEKKIQNITLKDLLTMTAPYKYRFAPYKKYFSSRDWVTFTLDLLGGRGKTGKFRYTPMIGPDILSGILTKATGQSVLEFARENLFSPLGITVENQVVFHSKEEQLAWYQAKDISCCVADETGVSAGGWGLTLSPVDMAKIGQLYLDDGTWEGKQIVSPEWVRESTREQSCWERRGLPYGYLWWIGAEGEDSFAAMGDGGNIIYVNREKKMVVAITSYIDKRPRDRIRLIKEYMEPAFD